MPSTVGFFNKSVYAAKMAIDGLRTFSTSINPFNQWKEIRRCYSQECPLEKERK
jgi:hypothetical protein